MKADEAEAALQSQLAKQGDTIRYLEGQLERTVGKEAVKDTRLADKVCSSTVCPQLLFALSCCLPPAAVRPQSLFALNYCLPSTTVCPQSLFALN